jgi:hypothetical protein
MIYSQTEENKETTKKEENYNGTSLKIRFLQKKVGDVSPLCLFFGL